MRTAIVGAGHYVPDYVVKNDMLIKVVPDWGSADVIEKKLGITERRFLWPLRAEFRMSFPPPPGQPWTAGDMAARALKMALDSAGMRGEDLDMVCLVNCTPDWPIFSRGVMDLHERFGLRMDAEIDEFSSGCGGAAFRLRTIRRMIEAGIIRRAALVATNATSPCFTDPGIYSEPTGLISEEGKPLSMALSAYVFGDGAGAVILEGKDSGPSGIVNSFAEVDYGHHVFRDGGGIIYPGNRRGVEMWRHGYYVDGKKVAKDYFKYMEMSVRGALAGYESEYPNISRFYLHQVNRRILEKFVALGQFPVDRVPVHVNRLGNISAACTLVLLSEDIHAGRVTLGSGDLVLLAAMGAGVHLGGHLIRL